MLIKYNKPYSKNLINIFGNGELLTQIRPLLEEEGINITNIFDDILGNGKCSIENFVQKEKMDLLFCVGYKDMKKRFIRYKSLKINNNFMSYIAGNAILSSLSNVGNGTIINQGVIIDNFVSIGECVFVNIGSTISHHTEINDNVFIAPGANIAGYVTVNEGVFVGINATIIDHLKIGEYSIVAAGAVVIEDVPPYSMVAGNPAIVKKWLK